MQASTIRVRAGSYDELAVIAERAQAFTNASGTAIALSEGNADEIICRARAGSSAPEPGTALQVEGTFTGLCVQSGKDLCCDDAETDTRVDKAAIRALGIRSMVAIPIKKEEGRVVGVLAAFSYTAHAFRLPHVAVLKTMADEIAAYLERKQRDEAYSPEPLPAPSTKTTAVSPAASSAVPPPAAAIKPAAPASMPRQFPIIPKVEPVQAGSFPGNINPAPSGKRKKTNSHDEQKEPEPDFQRAFSTLEAVAAPKNRPSANLLMIGAAAVLVIAVAVGISLKLRRSAAAAQPAPETSTSPGSITAPAPDSANVQPPLKSSPLGPPANQEEAEPKSEVTVVLSARPSRISPPQPANSARAGAPAAATDNPALPSDTPVILGNVPASGSLSNLANAVSQPARPRVVTQSQLEPATVIKKVQPVYPPGAKQQGLRGSVVVLGTVDKNGRISELRMLSGSPLFRNAAFEAVRQWVFKPARLNGQAIEQSTTIRLDFSPQ